MQVQDKTRDMEHGLYLEALMEELLAEESAHKRALQDMQQQVRELSHTPVAMRP